MLGLGWLVLLARSYGVLRGWLVLPGRSPASKDLPRLG
jgi:hypothetical protein